MTEAAEKAIRFWEAQDKAEQEGKNEFICPLCGGKAWWYRSEYNGHIHCGCDTCKFLIMQ